MKLSIQKDQNDVCTTDIHKPFKSHKDAITRLTPYHVYSEPMPNERMQHKGTIFESNYTYGNEGGDNFRKLQEQLIKIILFSFSQHVTGQVSLTTHT